MPDAMVRSARPADIPGILELQYACYPVLSTIAAWREEHLNHHQRVFPEGQLVAEIDGRVVGHAATFMTRSAVALKPHTFRDITARGTFEGHDPSGDTLYGAEIMVHPDARRRGIGSQFYRARFQLVRSRRLRYFVAGGRMPGYAKHAAHLSPLAYARAVEKGKIQDRVLSVQVKNGLAVRGVVPNYLSDPKSGNFASLLVWENPDVRYPRRATGSTRGSRGKD